MRDRRGTEVMPASISALPRRLLKLRKLPRLSPAVGADICASRRRRSAGWGATSGGGGLCTRQNRRTAELRSWRRRSGRSVRLSIRSMTSAQVGIMARDRVSVDITTPFVTYLVYGGQFVITP